MCRPLDSHLSEKNQGFFLSKPINAIFPKNPITKRRSLHLIPNAFMNALGNSHFQLDCPLSQHNELIKKYPFIPEIFEMLVANAKAKYHLSNDNHWEIRIQNSSVINAYCLPGGKVAITTGILEKFKEEGKGNVEDLVAAVLGHEISHALAEHGRLKLQINLIAHLIIKVAAWVFSWVVVPNPIISFDNNKTPEEQKEVEVKAKERAALQRNAVYRAIQLPLKFLTFYLLSKHSQSCEFEADKYGIEIMHLAKYNPQAAVDIQKIFLQLEAKRSWWKKMVAFDIFSTHPSSLKRIEANQKMINSLPPYPQQIEVSN